MIYKVSYVIIGMKHPGAILNQEHAPEVGQQVRLGNQTFEVVEVMDLLPPMGDFAYLHVTCRPLDAAEAAADA
jgi:hypothetical protein